MIYDSQSNLDKYLKLFKPEAADVIRKFLTQLTPTYPNGSYELLGKELRCNVASYDTKDRGECLREVHRNHIDIQLILAGAENNDSCPAEGLQEETSYDEAGDYQFLDRAGKAGVEIPLLPGRFVIYFPEDAHLTGIRPAGVVASVKKAVFKVHLTQLA